MKVLAAFFALALVVPMPQAFANLVQVSSTYPDDYVFPRQMRVRGGGLLFSYGQRFFVFTASHLSQGRDTSITLGSRPLNIVNRSVDPNNDLEIFEVSGLSLRDVAATYSNGHLNCKEAIFSRRRWVDSYNFVVSDPWFEDPNLATDNSFALSRPQSLHLDLFSFTLQSPAMIVPGMSGAPLITLVPSSERWTLPTAPYDMRENLPRDAVGSCLVRGLTLQRERFFSQTQFLPVMQMLPLLHRYLAGERSTPKFHWHVSGAVLYRVMDGYTEAPALAAAFAGPHVSVLGDRSPVIGGDLATIEEDSPREFLQNSTSASVKGSPQLHWSLSLGPLFNTSALEFSSWFDMNIYVHLKASGPSKIFSENQPTNFLSLLRQRLGRLDNFEIIEPAYMRLNSNNVLIRVPVEDGDELRLQLNRHGAFCIDDTCQSRFQPVVEAVSRKGRSYIVDLRELFFVQPGASVITPLVLPDSNLLSHHQLIEHLRAHFESELMRPRLTFRRKCPPQPGPMSLEQGLKSIVEWQASSQ